MRDKAIDALLLAIIKVVSQLEAMIALLDRANVVKKLREVLDLLDGLPTLENDLAVIKNRLRSMLSEDARSSDPDKTPRAGISVPKMERARPETRTSPGIGGISGAVRRPPLPGKKDDEEKE